MPLYVLYSQFQMMQDLGCKVTLEKNPAGEGFPDILLGQLGNDPKKKTVCLYGHLDVQPANKVSYLNILYFLKNHNDAKVTMINLTYYGL